ncbi:hypothetical protein GGI16_002134 [Coemansia sp. S142-1]|nr:hypothetical protein LPJ71_001801 [Coemansia sp. S17]KAJ2105954.1 hypothetical protein GGI16_002134 [Coemansia sp. S142-1]
MEEIVSVCRINEGSTDEAGSYKCKQFDINGNALNAWVAPDNIWHSGCTDFLIAKSSNCMEFVDKLGPDDLKININVALGQAAKVFKGIGQGSSNTHTDSSSTSPAMNGSEEGFTSEDW